jgi:endonuclease/exonuclease/phosphatase family metal-dependent hydrolase
MAGFSRMKTTIKQMAKLSIIALLWLNQCAYAETLSLASWNMEWLTSSPVVKMQSSQRSDQDIDAYRRVFSQIKPAIFSFQEVNDIDIVRKIIGDDYTIFLSDRAKPTNRRYQFSDINQYTGVAVINSLHVTDPADIVLSHNNKLRFATYVQIKRPEGKPLHLLSVHLKSGCITQYRPSKSSCNQLKQQTQQLNRWLKSRTSHNDSYIILGDFNHNLAYPNDWMWNELIAGLQPAPELKSRQAKAKCIIKSKNGRLIKYPSLIDHIVASPDIEMSQVAQFIYAKEWVEQYKLSDHCPIQAVFE